MLILKNKQKQYNKYKMKYKIMKTNIIISIIQKNYKTLITVLNNIIFNYKTQLIIIYLKII